MAFLPQPPLPVTSYRPSQARVSIRAEADGVISASRRRRAYDFLPATTGTTPATTASEVTIPPASALASSNGISTESPDPVEVREKLIARMKEREEAIKCDAEEKAALWEAELDALRTHPIQLPEPAPEPVEEEKIFTEPVPSYSPSRSSATASLFGGDEVISEPPTSTVAAATFAYTMPAALDPVSAEVSSSAPSEVAAPSKETETSSRSVPYLDTTPSKEEAGDVGPLEKIQEMVEDVREAVEVVVEDVRDAVEDVVDDVMEAIAPTADTPAEEEEALEPEPELKSKVDVEPEAKPKPELEKDPELKAEPKLKAEPELKKPKPKKPELKAKPKVQAKLKTEAEPGVEPKPERELRPVNVKQDRTIGEVIIDAIVEGVPTSESAPKPVPEHVPEPKQPAVDKVDLIQLIDSGKIKNLTVTKLRRLLSSSGLKTTGRKAELIARLTSFAKAK